MSPDPAEPWPATARAPGRAASRGSVTAEFAAVIPAVLIVLLACLAALQVAGLQLRLQDASTNAARALSRGDPESAVAVQLDRAVAGARLTVVHRGDVVCAESAAEPPAGIASLSGITVRASGCARSGGL